MRRASLESYLAEKEESIVMVPYSAIKKLIEENIERSSRMIKVSILKVASAKESLRRMAGIMKIIDVDSSNFRTVAVDAGYNGIETAAGFRPVVIAVAALFRGARKEAEPIAATMEIPDAYMDEEEGRRISSLVGFYLQFRLAREFLSSVDAVLLDGPLNMGFSHFMRRFSREGIKLAEMAGSELVMLLEDAKSLDIPVLGVVKRIRSSVLSRKLKLSGISDLAVSDAFLSRGEYTEPIKADWMWDDIVLWSRLVNVNPSGLEMYSSFAKLGRRPIRVDMPEYCIDRAGEILSHLANISTPDNGVPLPITAVDRLSKVSDELYRMFYMRTMSKVARDLGDPTVIPFLSPQYGED
ncbi:MAG: DNA double-strand break repair nuclease NurA [Candidatus Methanodesulfokora sp.]